MHQPILGAGPAAARPAAGAAPSGPWASPAWHRWRAGPIGLVAALCLAATATTAQPIAQPTAQPTERTSMAGACPAAQAPVAEHFIAADCPLCWSAAANAGAGPDTGWRFDWIVPTRDDAPMALAALRDSHDRLQRLGQPAPAAAMQWLRLQPAGISSLGSAAPASAATTTTGPAAGPPATASDTGPVLRAQRDPATDTAGQMLLAAQAGPAWLGNYMALQFTLLADQLPAGSTGWLAMVELLPAGSEGSAEARALMRNVAGPLPLDSWQPGQPLSHLRAMRWPEGTDPTRLQARAWIEAPDGRLLAVVADRCPVR